MSSETANERDATKGLGSIFNPVKYRDQDYEQLKAECLAAGTLFEDPEFPADSSSLGVKKLGPNSKVAKGLEWKRPTELYNDPYFVIEGATRDDIHQGYLGDCWFLTSVVSLTMNDKLLHLVIPGNQSFKTDYAGIFHFVIWQYGQWMSTVVDDRLPSKDGHLTFLRSNTNEYWSALIEKAYAKLCGCYEALIMGSPSEAMTDLTAGVSEIFFTDDPDLLPKLQKGFKEKFFISCITDSRESAVNLSQDHAYSLTGLEEVTYRGEQTQLIRVRNPWGFSEWIGPWSDEYDLFLMDFFFSLYWMQSAPEWDQIDPEVKANLNLRREDGEFWMSFSDFIVEFYEVNICNISLSKEYCGENYQWHRMQFNGRWTGGSNAGGSLESGLFWTNPKFRIKLQDPDEEDENNEKKCNIVVSLMQMGQRVKKPSGGRYFSMGFYIFKITGDEKIGRKFFKANTPVAGHEGFWSVRELARPFKLPPGDYVIVAAIQKKADDVDFCLRIFAKNPFQAEQLDDNVQEDPMES
ncbi:calpain-8-like [Gastrophryne carolinensis]